MEYNEFYKLFTKKFYFEDEGSQNDVREIYEFMNNDTLTPVDVERYSLIYRLGHITGELRTTVKMHKRRLQTIIERTGGRKALRTIANRHH